MSIGLLLHKVRGCAASTLSHHGHASRCFLDRLESSGITLGSVYPRDIEVYITHASKRLCRASLGCSGFSQQTAGALDNTAILTRFLPAPAAKIAELDREIEAALNHLPAQIDTVTGESEEASIENEIQRASIRFALSLLSDSGSRSNGQ